MSLTRLPPTNLFKLISLNFIISERQNVFHGIYKLIDHSLVSFFSLIDYLKPHPSLYHIMTAT